MLFVLIISASAVCGAFTPVKRASNAEDGYGHSSRPKCHDKKDRQCHKIPKEHTKQVCYEEFGIIEDTVFYEECENIVETYCENGQRQESSQKAHTSTTVLGHDSKLVGHGGDDGYGHGFGKRDAEPSYGYSDYSEPRCHDKKDRKCHKVPLTNKRKVPTPICKEIYDTTYIEECEDIITSYCDEYHEHGSNVGGGDYYGYSNHGGYDNY